MAGNSSTTPSCSADRAAPTAVIERLFSRLDEHPGALPLNVLTEWLQDTPVDETDVERFIRFHPDHYLRNLMHAGPNYHALVLCWRAGQRSPIHDHTGSACAVRIIRGTATETFFDRAPNGMIYATGSRTLRTGAICASQDRDIHQVSNLQPVGDNLVTLHIYSPPLLSMNVYSLVDNHVSVFVDPINEDFTEGSGI